MEPVMSERKSDYRKRLIRHLLSIAGLATSIGILTVLLIDHQLERQQFRLMVESAENQSRTITAFRSYYTQEVVPKILENSDDLTFSHDYRESRKTLPLPATVTIDMGALLANTEGDTAFNLISDFPFENRKGRVLSAFEKEALLGIITRKEETITDLDEGEDGSRILQYAEPVVMMPACVACHNTHPLSQKKDWKVGDVRGIQTVTIRATPEAFRSLEDWYPLIGFYSLTILGVLAAVAGLSVRNQRYITELQDNAEREKQSRADLKDITRQFIELEETLSDAIASLPDGFVIYDRNDRLVMCNEKYREFYSKSADLLVPGRTFEEIIRRGVERGQYPEADGQEDSWISERLEIHKSPVAPIEQRLDDGRWLRIFERPTKQGGIVGFRVDITELKRREIQLQAQRAQLAATIDTALDAIIIIDSNGVIIEFNPAATAIFGYTRDECVGQKMSDLIVPDRHKDAHEAGMDRFRRTRIGKILGTRVTIEAICKDGSEITIELAINPAEGDSGTIFVGYMRDITDDLAQKKALEEAKEAAEQATQTKAAFLAVVSHEIRTPLNGVLGLLDLIDSSTKDEKVKNYAKTAIESADALATLLNDILDYTKLEEGEITVMQTAFNFRTFAEGTLDLMRPLAHEKNLVLGLEIDEAVPAFIVEDQVRLRQIVLNLIANAIKFTETGSVQLRAKLLDDEEVPLLSIEVEDTGIGIDDEHLPLVFEQFKTLDTSYERKEGGTGLGLAISRGLSNLLGGQLRANSKPGEGSTFSLTLPISKPDQTPEEAHASNIGEIKFRLLEGRKVLLAEDNLTNNLVMSDMLENEGASVTSVANGKDALMECEKTAFDLIILDISMPVMDGKKSVKLLREKGHKEPILAFTAYTQSELRPSFIEAGFTDILLKPARRRDLEEVIMTLHESDLFGQQAKTDDNDKKSPSPEPGDIDMTEFERVIASTSGEIRHRLIEACIADLQSHTEQAMSAAGGGRTEDISRHAHAIKGVAATFGFAQLQEAAARLSDGTVHLAPSEWVAETQHMSEITERTRNAISTWFSTKNTALEDTSDFESTLS
ncbi:MAG: ATP-binding protein [Pseudomonadota bacterium]